MTVALQAEAIAPIAGIIEQLGTAAPSDVTLREGVARADEIAPAVVAVVEHAADGAYLVPRQDNLLFWGIHVLAAARRTELCQPLLRLVRALPADELEELLGDATTETMAKVVISIFDGDTDALIDACADRKVNEYVRWSLISALTRLCFDGVVPREAMGAFLDRFEQEPLAEPGDAAWQGWQEAICLLGLEAMRERLRAACQDGRIEQRESDRQYWDDQLAVACNLRTGDASLLDREEVLPIRDVVEAVGWAERGAEDPSEGPTAGDLSDPAGAIALTDREIDWLKGFFARRNSRGLFEMIDGYYCSLVAGPGRATPDEYATKIWEIAAGDHEPAAMRYDSPVQAEYVHRLLIRHWNSIALRLGADSPHEPLLHRYADWPPGAGWASGFLFGLMLREKEWKPSGQPSVFIAGFMIALAGLAGRDNILGRKLKADERTVILHSVPDTLRRLHAFWRGRGDPLALKPLPKDFPGKIGRNEPCPCGSGKKFKRCCGASGKSPAN